MVRKLFITLIFLALLTACQDDNDTLEMNFDENEDVHLRVLLLHADHDVTFMELYKEAYEDKYSNVNITIEKQRNMFDLYLPVVIERYQPDIVEVHPFYMNEYKDLFVDLNQFIQMDGIDLNDFYSNLLQVAMVEGELVAIPLAYVMKLMFYDKERFDEVNVEYPVSGWTWDEVLLKAQQVNNIVVPPMLHLFEPILLNRGYKLLSEDYKAHNYLYNTDTINMMTQFSEMFEDYNCCSKDVNSPSMFISDSYFYLQGNFKENVINHPNIGVVSVPRFSEEDASTTISMSGIAILKDSDKQEEAWNFIRESFIENNEISQYVATERFYSTRKSVSSDADLMNHPYGKIILEEIEHVYPSSITLGAYRTDENLVTFKNRDEYMVLDFDNLYEQLSSMAMTWDKELDLLRYRKERELE